MYHKVKTYMEENRMLLPGDHVIAGVSGGGDSMAMLFLLKEYAAEQDITLRVVHVHHGIRGEEADRDAALVEETCRRYRIPCRIDRYPVPELAEKWKLGTEEAGRLVRKEAFSKEKGRLQGHTGRVRIALAHNQNDLAETMLHNLCRGTGILGLSTMRPVAGEIIRPLLCLEKREIEEYLEKNQIPHIFDSTNASEEYTRNRIRKNILPLLEEQVNLKAGAHMARTAHLLADAGDYLLRQGEGLLEQHAIRREDGYFLEEAFFLQEPVLIPYAILSAFGTLAGSRRDFSATHVEEVLALQKKQTGRQISLPGHLEACSVYGGVLLRLHEKERESGAVFCEALPVPGAVPCPDGIIHTKIFPFTGQKIEEKKYTKWLDYDKITCHLVVRTRRQGDFLVIRSDGAKKKLGRCLIDDKIPRWKRDQLLFVAAEQEILWIVGGRISEKYKITENTTRILELSYEGGTDNE